MKINLQLLVDIALLAATSIQLVLALRPIQMPGQHSYAPWINVILVQVDHSHGPNPSTSNGPYLEAPQVIGVRCRSHGQRSENIRQ